MNIFMTILTAANDTVEPLKLSEIPHVGENLTAVFATMLVLTLIGFILFSAADDNYQNKKSVKKFILPIFLFIVTCVASIAFFMIQDDNNTAERVSLTKSWALKNYDLVLNNTQASFLGEGGISHSRINMVNNSVYRASTTEGVVKTFVIDETKSGSGEYILRFIEDAEESNSK